jgi:hypothetical protein
MLTIKVNQTQEIFEQLMDLVQLEPVRLIEENCVVGYMVSAKDHQDMIEFMKDRPTPKIPA